MAQARNTPIMRFTDKPIGIDHHGFDPVAPEKAKNLVNAFKGLTSIDTSQNSFYITEGLLQDLTTYLRNGRRFDGFRFTFVLDENKKVTLVLTREYGVQDGTDERYYHIPELYEQRIEKCNLVDIIEYGRILVNDSAGISEGHLIDLDSAIYQKMVRDFMGIFCQYDSIPNFSVRAVGKLKQSNIVRLPEPPKYAVVYSYFVGAGILRYLSGMSEDKGIKIFLGYGPSTPSSTRSNMHLLAVGTANKSVKISQISDSNRIWGTFDSNIRYTLYRMAQNSPDDGGTLPSQEGPITMDGSSTCIRPRPPYSSDEPTE